MPEPTYRYTVCPRDCYDSCLMRVAVVNGRPVRVEGLREGITGGFLCPRGVRDHERLYSNRVLYPHVRVGGKPGKDFRRVDWGEALEIVSSKLRETLERYGPGSVLHLEYAGNMGLLTWYFPQRLWYAIGASKTDYSICSKSGHEAISLHYGLSYGVLPEELVDMRMVVFWGFNAAVSSPHMWRLALKARERGAKIVAIDARRSETARSADLWLNPRPGSDVALGYGVARVIIEQGYVDTDFIERWTVGYRDFVAEVMRWTPARIEEVTGLEWAKVESLGALYGKLRPSATMIGFGVQKSVNGAEAVRIASLIPALLGYHRGFYYSNSRGWLVDTQYLTGEKLVEKRPRVVSQVALAEYIDRGEFKFIYVYNMNPLLTLPGQLMLRRGLERDDVFMVVHDTHWTETCLYADVVLPAPTFLEKRDLVIPYSHRYIRLSEKVVEPIGESRDEVWVMRELARRLGLNQWFLYEDEMEAVKRALTGAIEDGSFEDLLRGKVLRLRVRPRQEYQTPSGKVEFYSARAVKMGLKPLPSQGPLAPREDVFVMINSATPHYTHTQFREIYGPIPPVVFINPADADRLGIKEGEEVTLYNDNGEVTLRAVIRDDVPPGVVWSPRQLVDLRGRPQNLLASCETQPIGGGPTFNSTLVRVRPAGKSGGA